MNRRKIETPSLLSTIWIFVLFNMIFRDLHQFASEGFMEELMSLKIKEELVLIYAFVVEIPIAMVLLSRILNDKVNKWTNIIAAIICLLGILSTVPSADMDDIFFTIIESAALITIIVRAWKLNTIKVTQHP